MAVADVSATLASRWRALRESLRPRMRELRFSLHLLRRSPLAIAGLGIVVFYLALAAIGPLLPLPPYEYNPAGRDLPPSMGHPMGTDLYGYDIFTGIVLAARVDTRIAMVVVGAAVALGVSLGVVSGYLGGLVDEAIMRITDVFLAIPGLILALAVAAALGRSLENVMIAIIVVAWPSYTRLVRGQALSLRENQYVEAARAVGARQSRIIFRHILPNTISPITVAATLEIGGIVILAAALSFIGIGAGPDVPEWGALLARGFDNLITGYWWQVTFPGLFIFLFVLGFNLFGDGLRDILDPRLRR